MVPQRQHALARDEADLARQVFLGIAGEQIGKAERKALDPIRAELRQSAGQLAEGLRDLERADWGDESEASARLWLLRDDLLVCLGTSGRATAPAGVHDAALRLAAGTLDPLRAAPAALGGRVEPGLPQALADGRLMRLLTQ